jgi:hypothetical protein
MGTGGNTADRSGFRLSIPYVAGMALLLLVSLLYYIPFNYPHYNSDNAIHVLMAHDLQLPRDLYFWGQRRLGSLLPVVAHPFGALLQIHPLYGISVVHYLFLYTGFLLLALQLRQWPLRLALFALIFLPLNEYRALILIGHPYSSQLFLGALFLLALAALRQQIISERAEDARFTGRAILLLIAAQLCYLGGIWVSEMSAALAVVPAAVIVLDGPLRKALWNRLKKPAFLPVPLAALLLLLLSIPLYLHLRTSSDAADAVYDRTFLDSWEEIGRNVDLFLAQLRQSLLLQDTFLTDNLFNWFTILLVLVLLAVRPQERVRRDAFEPALWLLCILSTIALFHSAWNLKNGFLPRYFTPLYVLFFFLLLRALERRPRWLQLAAATGIIAFSLTYCWQHVARFHAPGPLKAFSELGQLPHGTLIGDFWDVYKLASVYPDKLQALPFETNTVRNWSWRHEALAAENFYTIDNANWPHYLPRDRFVQFRQLFTHSGRTYTCNGLRIMHYTRTGELDRMRIRAHQGSYLGRDSLDRIVATVTDPAHAEVFTFTSNRLGTAIMAANERYITADFSTDGSLLARQTNAHDWELFEAIPLGDDRYHLRTRMGTYACTDTNLGGAVIADRDKAQEWEVFLLEPVE